MVLSMECLSSSVEISVLSGDSVFSASHPILIIYLQIQDYRNCLSQKAGADSAETSPTIHKVLLHMSMENVVKDVLSISNESWSYEDLLVSKYAWQQKFEMGFPFISIDLILIILFLFRKLNPAFLRLCNLIFA